MADRVAHEVVGQPRARGDGVERDERHRAQVVDRVRVADELLGLLEAAVILSGVVAILPAVARPATDAAPGLDAHLVLVLHLLHDWTFLVGPGLLNPINAALLATLLLRRRLVPRIVPWLGLGGAVVVAAMNLAVMLGSPSLCLCSRCRCSPGKSLWPQRFSFAVSSHRSKRALSTMRFQWRRERRCRSARVDPHAAHHGSTPGGGRRVPSVAAGPADHRLTMVGAWRPCPRGGGRLRDRQRPGRLRPAVVGLVVPAAGVGHRGRGRSTRRAARCLGSEPRPLDQCPGVRLRGLPRRARRRCNLPRDRPLVMAAQLWAISAPMGLRQS
ncbi:DUF4386 family protein [Yimella sp. RIT 621]|nr:DUF4386 family protein [Yimella sp. RIT 621]